MVGGTGPAGLRHAAGSFFGGAADQVVDLGVAHIVGRDVSFEQVSGNWDRGQQLLIVQSRDDVVDGCLRPRERLATDGAAVWLEVGI
jgi:hypothetical protein